MRATALALALTPALAWTQAQLPPGPQRALERIRFGDAPRFTQMFLLADIRDSGARRFTEFSGDLSGRYLEALSAAGLEQEVCRLVAEIAALQRPDGGFGRPLSAGPDAVDDDLARLWGAGRLLVGLTTAHRELERSPIRLEALDAARRLGDWLLEQAPRFHSPRVRREFQDGHLATGYVCWTQNIEGLAALYEAAGKQRFLDLARELAERVERRPGQHSHGLLTSLRGLLALYDLTGDERYLRRVETVREALLDDPDALPLPGAVAEYLSAAPVRDEGCSDADWLRLNLGLWRRTGRVDYLEEAERSYFNGFRANSQGGGDYGHVRFSPTGLEPGGSAAWWCCTFHGARAGVPLAASAFRVAESELWLEWPLGGVGGKRDGLRVRATRLGEAGDLHGLTVKVLEAPDGATRFAVRIPAWSRGVRLSLPSRTEGGYEIVERSWRAGETFRVDYRPRERWEPARRPGYVGAWLGPFLLGASEDASPDFFQEPYEHNQILFETLDGGAVRYLPAGYPSQPATLELTPLGERGRLRFQAMFLQDASAARTGRIRTKVRSLWIRALPAAFGALAGAVIALLGTRFFRR